MIEGATLTKNGDTLEIDISACRGMDFQDALAKIKDIPGRKFDGQSKKWLLPAEPLIAERVIHTIQPDADAKLLDWVREARTKQAEELTTKLPDDADLLIPWANKRMPWQPEEVNDEKFNGLFDYQRAAVDLMANVQRAILADDMGLGKTIQAISTVEEWRLRNIMEDNITVPDGPKIVVCPNSVKGTWARELGRWLEDPHFYIIDATTPAARHNQLDRAINEDAWAIVNWEQIRVKKERVKLRNGGTKTVTSMKEPLFEKTQWLAAIADEVHRAKNRKAQTTMGLWRIQAPLMLGLSGTPLMNTPDELWAILHWLFPKEYTSYWRFYEQYVDYYEGYFGKVITGVKNADALRFELKDRLIRRTVDGRTPGRKRIYYEVELNAKQRKLYDEAEKKLWIEVEQAVEEGDPQAIKFAQAAAAGEPITNLLALPNGAARTVRLRQIIETPANLGGEDDSAVLDDAVDKIMDSRPAQWQVFCEFKPTCEALVKRLEAKGVVARAYNGDIDPKVRTQIEDQYQSHEIDVVVGTIKAMGEGGTWTAGHNQYWVSRDWVPDKNEQGEARQDRTGQQKRVTVWIPQAKDTVAVSKIEPTNRLKERIVRTVLPKDHIEEVQK